jgi:hypothetical protein
MKTDRIVFSFFLSAIICCLYCNNGLHIIQNNHISKDTLPPSLTVFGLHSIATTTQYINYCVTDSTPIDTVVINFTDNNNLTQYIVPTDSSGSCFRAAIILLDPGKNTWSYFAIDKAGNKSNTDSGYIYYLPGGHLNIYQVVPDSNPIHYVYMPETACVIIDTGQNKRDSCFIIGPMQMNIKVQIDDGINNIPESIRHCQISGAGQSILMNNEGNYIYSANISLVPQGTMSLIIVVQDIAGNQTSKTISFVSDSAYSLP